MLVGDVFFDEPELNGRTGKIVVLAEITLHKASIAPVQKFSLATKDFEGWDRVVSFLDHVIQLGSTVLEAGRWVFGNNAAQPGVEFAGGDALPAPLVDFEAQIKQFGDVLPSYGAGED